MARQWEIPSSIPMRKTTGNSSPLAACSVIKVTWAGSSSTSSWSETSANSAKKSTIRSPESPRRHRNFHQTVTDKNSWMFSRRVFRTPTTNEAAMLPLYNPVVSRICSVNSVTVLSLTMACNFWIVVLQNRQWHPRATGNTLATSTFMAASSSDQPFSAQVRNLVSEPVPIPRLGSLITRSKLRVSAVCNQR